MFLNMKLLFALVLLCVVYEIHGLDCYTCTNSDYDGESTFSRDCFTTSSSTTSVTCPANSGSAIYYCRTVFTLQDGMATSVVRGCVSTLSDEDTTTTLVPTANKCETSLSNLNPVDTTNCYYHCTSDNCNTVTTTTLRTCSSDCSRSSGQGACNYITGSCVCNAGYSGADCSTTTATAAPTYRSCIQCNSETDSGCATSTTGTTCPSSEPYCSSAQTIIYDLTATNTDSVRTIITRGCTSNWVAVDECQFSNIYSDSGITSSDYSEYTCYSTCSTDNCNTNTPDGTVNGSEQKLLQCEQCTSTSGDCSSARRPCPSSSTHCKATVVYLISPKTDLNYETDPEYKFESVVRECASAEVTSECTETDVIGSLSLKKVTCQETCLTDGCNTGWPARPTCLQCSTSTSDLDDGYDTCLENPSVAQSCSYPYQGYCYIYDDGLREGRRESIDGYPRRIVRGCSHYDIGSSCSTKTIRDVKVQQCNHTCTTDGCNVGSDASLPLPALVAIVIPTVFGWMTTLYL